VSGRIAVPPLQRDTWDAHWKWQQRTMNLHLRLTSASSSIPNVCPSQRSSSVNIFGVYGPIQA